MPKISDLNNLNKISNDDVFIARSPDSSDENKGKDYKVKFSTIKEQVNAGIPSSIIEITWQELKDLRDQELLVPGQFYRITDYVTTTIQKDTQSAGHQFDIIIQANSINSFNEKVSAIQNDKDSYFNTLNLSAWQVWYCIDNDTSKFDWADENNGKGVIYRMIDENGNDCPYDFKNIMFYDSDDNDYKYTFSTYINSKSYDISSILKYVNNNTIEPFYMDYGGEYKYHLNKVIIEFTNDIGIIYDIILSSLNVSNNIDEYKLGNINRSCIGKKLYKIDNIVYLD